MNYNRVILEGRISRKDDLRQTGSGVDVLNFGLAVNRKFNGDEVDFFNVTAWRKTAELVAQYKQVGDLILVEGTLRTDKFEKDGQTRTSTYVVADSVVFQPGKGDGNSGTGNAKAPASNDDDTGEIPF